MQNLPLKPHGTHVKYFDGTLKPNTAAYCAVIDLPFYGIPNYECDDAIMRLRAEYLFEQKKILVGDDGKTPWYDLNFGDYLQSAEWTFTKDQLKKF